MAELQEAAAQFAKDLSAMNVAGLMMAFTPNGMTKAMQMQAQMAAQAGAAGGTAPAGPPEATVGEVTEDGEARFVDIHMKGPAGEAIIFTKWIADPTGAWKVDDMGLKAPA
jgi:hypothetical protein